LPTHAAPRVTHVKKCTPTAQRHGGVATKPRKLAFALRAGQVKRPPLPRNESRGDVLASSPNRRHQALALPDHLERVGRRCASLTPSPAHLLPPLPRRRPQRRPDPASAIARGTRPCPPAARLLGGSRGSPSRWISRHRAHAPPVAELPASVAASPPERSASGLRRATLGAS